MCTPEKGQGQSRTIWKQLKTHPAAALTQHRDKEFKLQVPTSDAHGGFQILG